MLIRKLGFGIGTNTPEHLRLKNVCLYTNFLLSINKNLFFRFIEHSNIPMNLINNCLFIIVIREICYNCSFQSVTKKMIVPYPKEIC